LPDGAEILERENGRLVLRVRRGAAPAVTAHLLQRLPISDLTVEDPPLEAVIDQIYQQPDALSDEAGRLESARTAQ
jgi:ABC-2 type transport system ATP-binding protein